MTPLHTIVAAQPLWNWRTDREGEAGVIEVTWSDGLKTHMSREQFAIFKARGLVTPHGSTTDPRPSEPTHEPGLSLDDD